MIFAVEQKGEMMDDLISRQAAIDAVEESRRLNHHEDGKEACCHEYEHRHFLKILYELPSAQPETNCSEFPNNSDLISRQAEIDDLKDKDPSQIWDTADIEVWINSLPSAQPEINTDGDTISRQQTIDALMQEFKRIPTNSIRAKLVVENLPSAQPERKTGRWIRSSNKLVPYYCSSCTGRFNYEWNFCPNCGAKMLKEGENIDS